MYKLCFGAVRQIQTDHTALSAKGVQDLGENGATLVQDTIYLSDRLITNRNQEI